MIKTINEQLEKVKINVISRRIKQNKELLDQVIQRTSYLVGVELNERLYHIMNDLLETPKCFCGNFAKFRSYKEGYYTTCCRTCSDKNPENRLRISQGKKIAFENIEYKEKFRNKTRQTNKERYGIENYSNVQKGKETKKLIYGDETYCNIEKIKSTKLIKYNSSTYNNTKLCRETKKQRYGNEKYCNPEKISRTRKLNTYYNYKKKYVEFEFLFSEQDYHLLEDTYLFKCKTCGGVIESNFSNDGPRCLNCNPFLQNTSSYEKEIQDWLGQLINIEKNKKYSNIYELDIFIPSKKIGIEFDGLYWHSESNGKDKNYHIDKTNWFKSQGITIIHVFEDEWVNNKEIVKSIILNKLGLTPNKIFARKTQVKKVSNKIADEFLIENHIQGSINSSFNIGLYHNDTLVSLMTFGIPRYNKKYDWELHRFCNLLNTSVVGGASKLFNWFTTNYIGSIVTYADLRFSVGNLYENLGMNYSHTSIPNYFYIKGQIRYNRLKFQKHKLSGQLKTFDPTLTEVQNMRMNGYHKIYDCGNMVFFWPN